MNRLIENEIRAEKDYGAVVSPYVFRLEEGQIRVCDICQYPAPVSDFEKLGETVYQCRLCANCYAEDSGQAHTTFCTNALLDQMGAFDNATYVEITPE